MLSAVRMAQAFTPGRRARLGTRHSDGGQFGVAAVPRSAAVWRPESGRGIHGRFPPRYLRGTGVALNIVTPELVQAPPVEQFYGQLNQERHWGDDWAAVDAGGARDLLPHDTGRMGTTQDVAGVVAFLASRLARFGSGAN